MRFSNWLILLTIIILVSCEKEELPTQTIFPPLSGETTASIRGRISDTANENIENAIVTCINCVSESARTTDKNGNFIFENVNVVGDVALLKVSFQGKFDCFRRLPLLENKENYTGIKLREKSRLGIIDPALGGILNSTSGASITFSKNAIVDANNIKFEERVSVYMSWIDPSSQFINELMMGDLAGIDGNNRLQALSSYGMLQVELEDSTGEKLNLKPGSTAILEFPIPNSMLNSAPETIPLWSYNETHGYWVEEGEATLTEDRYIAEVNHFSTWNVDSKIDPIEICGQVLVDFDESVFGMPFYRVGICGESFSCAGGWLCEDGSFRFINVPSGDNLTLEVYNYCSDVVYTQTLDSFQENVKLPPIIINSIPIVGNAMDCNLTPVDNGIVQIRFENTVLEFDLDSEGNFDFGLFKCQNTDIEMQIFDKNGVKFSNPIIISGLEEEYTFKDVFVCDDSVPYFYFFREEEGVGIDEFVQDARKIHYVRFAGFYGMIFTANDNSIKWNFELGNTPEINKVINSQIYDITDDELGIPLGQNIKLLITDLGALNAEGDYEYIEGSYNGFVTDNLWPVNGSFKIGPKN